MLASFLLYAGLIGVVIGAISLIRPLRFLRVRSRRQGALVACSGLLVMIVMMMWPTRETQATSRATRLDEFMPVWQFNERHSIHVNAPPARVFTAIRAVSAEEILFFRTLTTIRHFRRRGQSILNPPKGEPILDVALRGGFIMLADDAPRELVVGTVVVAPREARAKGKLTPEIFQKKLRPGIALATMNFLVTPDAAGSTVSTETRVFANGDSSRRRFAAYWRVIHPGSDIIRRMWLRGIKKRAESPRAQAPQ